MSITYLNGMELLWFYESILHSKKVRVAPGKKSLPKYAGNISYSRGYV